MDLAGELFINVTNNDGFHIFIARILCGVGFRLKTHVICIIVASFKSLPGPKLSTLRNDPAARASVM